MLTKYIEAAMSRARYEWLADSSEYYGEISELSGVWATSSTCESYVTELRDVLEGWIALGLALHHQLPVLDGVDVNVQAVA